MQSLYGFKTQGPLVSITMPGGESLQMTPAEAREHALAVLECAEAAEGDAFVIEFMRKISREAGGKAVTENAIMGILNDFRIYREKLRANVG